MPAARSLRFLGAFAVCLLASTKAPAMAAAEPPPPPQPEQTQPALPPMSPGELEALKRDVERLRQPAAAPPEEYDLGTLSVEGPAAPTPTPSAEFKIDLGQLGAIPRKSAAEHLMLAPGVLTTNAGGDGHANETFMRGFAAGEGKDIEFLVDGVPINDVSNPHTHGYAELFFIPQEIVQSVDVAAGPFDPRQGDFAFAGTARFGLGVPQRGSLVRYGFGSWNTHRALLLIAPEDQPAGTFGAVEYVRTNGFGQNRAAQRANAVGRLERDEGDWRWSISLFGSASRYDQAGVVRQDDFALGRKGFYDTYDPNQGGETDRLLASFSAATGARHSRFDSLTWVGLRSMRLRENFTGWTSDPTPTPGAPQRGDGLELRYQTLTLGHRGEYSLSGELGQLEQSLQLGWSARYDRGEAGSFRLRSITAVPYHTQFEREFNLGNLALLGHKHAAFGRRCWLRSRPGRAPLTGSRRSPARADLAVTSAPSVLACL